MSECFSPPVLWDFLIGNSLGPSCQSLLLGPESLSELSLAGYLNTFFWTLFMELPIYLILFKNRYHGLLGWLLANLLTHPVVTFGFPFLFVSLEKPVAYSLLSSEIFAFVTEAVFIRWWWNESWVKALIIAFVANLLSWWVGALLPANWF